jgi:organic radical activating enzyme
MKNIDVFKDSKIIINILELEVTRKCNLKCAHCLKGDACNVSMDLSTIDSVFKQVDTIETLSLCGGEPFLVPETIRYIVRKAKEYGVIINNWDLITNGTIYSDNVIDVLFELDDYCTDKDDNGLSGRIEISSDEFHEEAITKLGKRVELILKRNIIMNKLLLPWYSGVRQLKEYIVNDGRSLNLNRKKGNIKVRKYNLTALDDEIKVFPCIYISTNGIVTIGTSSYENQISKYNFGNINELHILDCIKNNLGKVTDLGIYDRDTGEFGKRKTKKDR